MKQKQDFSLIITTVLIILLMVFLYLGGVFASLDKKFIDVVTVANLNANKAGKNNVAFAIISDATLKLTERFYKMGWPWRREMYGRVAEFTRLCGAKNTIYDFHFTERSVFQVSQTKPYREIDDDGAFAAAIKKNGNVILAYQNLTRASKSTQKTINPHFLKHALTVIKNDNSVHFKDYPAIYGPIHPLLKATSGVGCVNTSLDSDGIARRIRLVYKYRGKFYPGLSLASYMQSKKIKQVSIINKTIKVGDISIPVDKNGFYRVKFYGDNNVYYDFNLLYMFLALDKVKRHYSLYSKLINKTPHFTIEEVCRDKRKYSTMLKQVNDVRRKRHVSAKKFKPLTVPIAGMKRWKKNGKYLKPVPLFPWTLHNKYVIVASIASSLQDVWPTPMNPQEAGAHIHLSAIDNMLQQDFLSTVENPLIYLFILITLILAVSFICSHMSIVKASLLSFMLLLITPVLCWILFTGSSTVFFPISGMASVAISFTIITTLIRSFEKKQKAYLKHAFSQYLSPKVINIIMDNPSMLKLGGQKRNMTAFFSDLQGFSSISESLSPEDLVGLLNDYLTRMCDIITKYEGTIDKFEGDAIIAFWGAPLDQPDHAYLACKAAIEMQEVMETLRQEYSKVGKPQLHMRIGINTGDIVVGNMGSNYRMDYTIMGDAVNLAARLEGANKIYHTYTMVSHHTNNLIKDRIISRELDNIKVMGKNEPVTVFELLGTKT